MGADGRAGGAAGACAMSEGDGKELTVFVPDVADSCSAAGIRE
jgi:hypothetical protein